jgi:hypothetical protein
MKRLLRSGAFLLIATAVAFAGCSDSGDSSPTSSSGGSGTQPDSTADTIPSFAQDIRPIILAKGCLGSSCHGTAMQSGLSLGAGNYTDVSTASGNNGAFVIPGNASQSNFYLKTSPSPPFGSRMPLTGNYLSADELEMVRRWIDQGAQDN